MNSKKDPGELIEEILVTPALLDAFAKVRDLLALPEERRQSLISLFDSFLEGGERHEKE